MRSPQRRPPGNVAIARVQWQRADYFRVWIVNLCLTLFTVGLFDLGEGAKRYFYAPSSRVRSVRAPIRSRF